ncbi:MAG: four helix bundle protein [Planctomycetaceae bacterium]|nr:four helix bundle protein [Planctomycetaceae bacterium]
MKTDNAVLDKSKFFAIRIVKLNRYLVERKKERVLSKQLLRSGTSIGANVREAVCAQSKNDFIHKMSIALKESSESEYWLELLFEGGYLSEKQFNDIYDDCREVSKLLMAIVRTSKAKKSL